MKTMDILKQYISTLTGTATDIPARPDYAGRLPVFLAKTYDTYEAELFQKSYLLLALKNGRPTPAQIAKHMDIVRGALGRDIVFVLPELPTFERKRLIERHVPFIVPGRQTYLPMALIDLREQGTGEAADSRPKASTLSAPAQLLILCHLQGDTGASLSLKQWAQRLGYSQMTLTRAQRELVDAELADTLKRGRQTVLTFQTRKRPLWKRALPLLQSPVRTRIHARLTGRPPPMYEAGMTALSRHTALAPDPNPVYAMAGPDDYRAAQQRDQIAVQGFAEEDTVVIERWRYAPAILAGKERTVDPLSLYLSLCDDPDERVQAALTELMETMPW